MTAVKHHRFTSVKGSRHSPTRFQAANFPFHSNQDTNPPQFHSLPSRKPQKNLQGQYDPVPAFQRPIICKKLGVREIQEASWEAWLLPAMTNPCSLQCVTITLCSCLHNGLFLHAVLRPKALLCTSSRFHFLPVT